MNIIAHRGYSARYPELTPIAFEKALALPIHGIECDIRLTLDGEVVVVHDPIIDRVANGRGRVSAMTLAQLRKYNFGTPDNPQTILTLRELLAMVTAQNDKHIYIETKHPMRYGRMLEEQLVRVLQYQDLIDDPRIHVISFSPAAIMRMRTLAPGIDRIHLRRKIERWLNPVDTHPGEPTGLGLSVMRARRHPELVSSHNLPTYMWTVNTPNDMQWAREAGVKMMATDDPELALETLEELNS
ncbi:glycerophosphodiester phosphodiesterase [Corynebacterium alimapuense]|uniref:Glycerophosphodiester phosphodiesterase n=1 Tax=Corynebacterium alimapuense TaxID=1576874 RepID=A0A3M8KBV9_9CORY|nr:glycerophosphodiester phosphodiesterase [Corynebacterium alimapuense]RNE50012.1 glycerophosphodiester phosphodiesterase [Corynebacterium alimapuense]